MFAPEYHTQNQRKDTIQKRAGKQSTQNEKRIDHVEKMRAPEKSHVPLFFSDEGRRTSDKLLALLNRF